MKKILICIIFKELRKSIKIYLHIFTIVTAPIGQGFRGILIFYYLHQLHRIEFFGDCIGQLVGGIDGC